MSWKNLLKEFRDSIELVKEMEDIVRAFENDLFEIKSYIDYERRMAEKKDFGIPYEEVLSELKEEVKSGLLNENDLVKILLEKLQ
tara:strand:- start:8 stop:262 length:255 start_codon:yes stop_codon:yes gene_type:complete